ncbi:late embryogenesis abundant protein 46-like [Nicotiana tomentosiformis]|uniref:late embryogenesis abundant protein 46-like n=1 Tax=Nicotiana tomentosiformis TaxID=4098 RepID=UPI00051BAAE2|nr:late embryogenesis abundant protein 46-like [Nicotiana tomentosiformis]
MQSVKEKASNVAASAKSGVEKTKAVVQEKVERMTAHDPTQKEMATGKKEERINQAEMSKQATHDRNAAIHQGGGTGTGRPHYSNSTTGATGYSTGAHQMSALPGHGTGEPMGQVTDGVVQSHPIGTATRTQRASAAHNTHVGGGVNQGYGIGGNYS